MEKVYKIFSFETKTVCTPNEDYYARSGDWVSDNVECLDSYPDEFETIEEAEKEIEKNFNKEETYTILPVYSFKK